MNALTHQTITLSKGKHASADEGACVMELASMLAGEAFSDRPRSVCPVIGSFLRAYNDAVGDERRQALYWCAAQVVGSAGTKEQLQARADYLGSLYFGLRARRHPWMRLLPRRRTVTKQRIGIVAARTARMIALHEEELAVDVIDVVDDLVAAGGQAQAVVPPRREAFDPASEAERMAGLRQLVEPAAKRH